MPKRRKVKLPRTRLEMPHPGHFIGSNRCHFRRNTYINGYIVSTVGEYRPLAIIDPDEKDQDEDIGFNRKYETMVFEACESGDACCPFVQANGNELDLMGYNDPGEAQIGHEKMVQIWGAK